MSVSNRSGQGQRLKSTQVIQRAIWVVSVALVVSLLAFVGYYVWDRYVHLGDQSPVELNIKHMEEAIKQEPENAEARVALAESYLRSGRYTEALAQTEQVIKLYPDIDAALLIAGIAHVRLEQPESALDPLEHFVALRKDQPMAHTDKALEAAYYFLGESYVKLDRPAEAIPLLEAALLINRADADALYQAGLAYHATGQPEIAVERFHQAVRLVPDFADAYHGMIEGYAALDQSDYVAYARGMEAFSLNDYQTAKTHLEHATEALPDFGPAFLGMGLVFEKMGQYEAALAAIQRALELNPDDFAAQQALGRIQAVLSMGTQS